MTTPTDPTITVSKNGPYVVKGELPVVEQHIVIDKAGQSIEWREGKSYPHEGSFKLCRCGHSKNKPFCDSSHKQAGFDGTETAGREPYDEQAELIDGPTLSLKDAERLCAFARFCDPNGQVWGLVTRTDDQEARIQFLHEAGHCPGGRLVAVDNASGADMEPRLPVSIGLVEDTRAKVSGPIWVRGGVQVIGADGYRYEVRNRVALCRCGRSSNKPFCDGSHAAEA
ncbi:MAG: CDGSH iron-sulfur domain-containing protein [Gemmatimonadales bacterium]